MLKQVIYGILFSLFLLTGINSLHAEETRKETPTKAKELMMLNGENSTISSSKD